MALPPVDPTWFPHPGAAKQNDPATHGASSLHPIWGSDCDGESCRIFAVHDVTMSWLKMFVNFVRTKRNGLNLRSNLENDMLNISYCRIL